MISSADSSGMARAFSRGGGGAARLFGMGTVYHTGYLIYYRGYSIMHEATKLPCVFPSREHDRLRGVSARWKTRLFSVSSDDRQSSADGRSRRASARSPVPSSS